MKATIGIFAAVLALALTSWASTEKVVLNFDGTNGGQPWSNYFITDGKGNLYGATADGGTYDSGVVFMLSQAGQTILYEFKGQSNGDGANPCGRLAFDSDGNIFGTTQSGGTNGTGTVYEISPVRGGGWTETVIYNFSATTLDGAQPSAGMTIFPDGSMFSTAANGGAYGAGVVFGMKKTTKGWQQKVIHSFNFPTDGGFPYEGVVRDADGNLYGVAAAGGATGNGVIYRVSNSQTGAVYTVIYSFTNQNGDGSGPYWINLVSDKSGNLYGATSFGGTNGNGMVWELTDNNGTYSETVLYDFGASGSGDGNNPYGGLAIDINGNLYGATLNGGSANLGTAFALTKQGTTWKETVLHSFIGGNDGDQPTGNPCLVGNALYGMAEQGGTSNEGVVYRIAQ